MLLPAVGTQWRVQQTTLANRILEKGQGSVHQFPKWTHFWFNWSFQESPVPVCALAHTPTHSCMYMSPYRQPQHGAPIFASLSPVKIWDSIVLAQSMWHAPLTPNTTAHASKGSCFSSSIDPLWPLGGEESLFNYFGWFSSSVLPQQCLQKSSMHFSIVIT